MLFAGPFEVFRGTFEGVEACIMDQSCLVSKLILRQVDFVEEWGLIGGLSSEKVLRAYSRESVLAAKAFYLGEFRVSARSLQ